MITLLNSRDILRCRSGVDILRKTVRHIKKGLTRTNNVRVIAAIERHLPLLAFFGVTAQRHHCRRSSGTVRSILIHLGRVIKIRCSPGNAIIKQVFSLGRG